MIGFLLGNNRKKILVILAVVITILLVGLLMFYLNKKKTSEINSFDECAAAGYPILESYPEQCITKDGRHFTRILSE